MKRILLIFLFLPAWVWGSNHTITSLPYTTTASGTSGEWDTLFINGTRLKSATNGVYIAHNYICLNLDGDTIAFGGDAGLDYYGIRTGWLNYGLEIVNGYIIYDPDSIPWDDDWVNDLDLSFTLPPTNNNSGCIRMGGTWDALVKDVNIIIRGGWNHKGITGTGSPWLNYNWEFDNVQLWDSCNGFYDRCGGSAIAFNMLSQVDSVNTDLDSICITGIWTYGNVVKYYAPNVTPLEYNFKIHDCIIHIMPFSGIRTYRKSLVYDCSLYTDVENVLLEYPTASYCLSSANADAILLHHATPPATIHDNQLIAGTDRHGGRGIQIEGPNIGKADSQITVYNNYVVSNQGNDSHYPALRGAAFKIRNANEYVHVYDNTFISYTKGEYCVAEACREADTVAWADGISEGGYFCIQSLSDFPGIAPYWPQNCTFERNLFRCIAVDSAAHAPGMTWEKFGNADTISSNIWRYNRIESNRIGLEFGTDINGTAKNLVICNDTIVGLDTLMFGNTFQTFSGWIDGCTNNTIRDCVYEGLASDTGIDFKYTVSTGSIILERTLDVLVTDSTDGPLADAIVEVKNEYAQDVGTDTTGEDGYAHIVCRYWLETPGADSTGYNPFDYIAFYGGDTSEVLNFVLSDTTYTDTLQLTESGEAEKTNHHLSKWRK